MHLTLRQVAHLFSVPENKITGWVQQENLPTHEVNSQYHFDRAEVLEWAVSTQHPVSAEIFKRGNGGSKVSLAEALDRGGVGMQIVGNDRYEVLRSSIADLPIAPGLDRGTLLELLMAREKSGGSGIGHGIAIPHPRYPIVLPFRESVARVCYLECALEYPSVDGRPVDTLFLTICPTVHEHLELLARLASVLRGADFRTLLASRPDKTRLLSAVRAAERTFDEERENQPT